MVLSALLVRGVIGGDPWVDDDDSGGGGTRGIVGAAAGGEGGEPVCVVVVVWSCPGVSGSWVE